MSLIKLHCTSDILDMESNFNDDITGSVTSCEAEHDPEYMLVHMWDLPKN